MRIVIATLTCVLAIIAFSSIAMCETALPVISNAAFRLGFDPSTGSISRITDMFRGRELLAAESVTPLWSIKFVDGTLIRPGEAKGFTWKPEDNVSRELVLKWYDFDRPDAPELAVVATVMLDDHEAVSRWRIEVTGLGSQKVDSVSYPRIGSIKDHGGDTMAVPYWIGEKTKFARQQLNSATGKGNRQQWDYPGTLSMQFITFYADNGAGLLLSTNDTQMLRKQFAAFGDGAGGVGLEAVHLAAIADEKTVRYEPPYDVQLRLFEGDWYTAADHYRNWANQQWWVNDSRVRSGETPAWVRDTGLWVWNRGRSPGVVEPAIALQERAQLPVSVFWHWWHGCSYDVGFPEYLPPREGTQAFRAAVAEAESHDIHAIVYMNQRLWGMTTKSWTDRNAAEFAVKQPDGTIHPEVYNTFVKAPCASMCIATPFWRETYAELAEAAVCDLGVAGVYMDQACSSLSCYDPSHGHPLGGGSYWMNGFKTLQADIRERTKGTKAVALAGEGCGEAWLPYLDMMLSLQVSLERYHGSGEWDPVPLFNTVYHDCAIQFGNYASLTYPPYDDLWPAASAPKEPLALLDQKFATQFRLEQARSFVWGQQPALANFREEQLELRAKEIDFVVRIAQLRMAALSFLRDGVFLRPPEINASLAEIPSSRLSIYAGQQGGVQESTQTVPMMMASAWQAPNGEIGIAVANIAEGPLPLKVTLTQENYPLPEKGTVYRRTDQGRQRTMSFADGTVTLDEVLEGEGLRMYEIVGDSN